jgi:Transcriptional regulator
MEKSENPQNLFIKECLFTALLSLIKKKSLYDISITELAKRAGVSRMAFYRNYNSTQDIITDYLDSTTLGIDKQNMTKIMYLPDTLRCVFNYFYENRFLIEYLIKINMTDLILHAIEKHFRTTFHLLLYSYGFQSDYEVSALIGIFYKILIDWTKKGMKDSITEMTKVTFNIINKFENY